MTESNPLDRAIFIGCLIVAGLVADRFSASRASAPRLAEVFPFAFRSAKGTFPPMANLPIIGWREWLALPDLDLSRIKAKVDTGARSSSLHAYDIEVFTRRGRDFVRFTVHPVQRETKTTIHCVAALHEHRHVKSSSGHREYRPIIRTVVELGGERWPIDLTLTTRDAMGFRMLLGREAIRRRFLVDSSRSYVFREHVPKRKKKKRRA